MRKNTSDGQFSTIFVRRLPAKRCFCYFLHFAYERNVIFPVFCISLTSEALFFPFSTRRSEAKVSNCRKPVFARVRRAHLHRFLPFPSSWFAPIAIFRENGHRVLVLYERTRKSVDILITKADSKAMVSKGHATGVGSAIFCTGPIPFTIVTD